MALDPKKLKAAKSKAKTDRLIKQSQALIKAATSRKKDDADSTGKEGAKKKKSPSAALKILKGLKDGVGAVSRKNDQDREIKRLELKKSTVPRLSQKSGGGARRGFAK